MRSTAVVMVEAEAGSVEAHLQAGEIECPECGQGLRPWGHARTRPLRDHGKPLMVRPRRAICPSCANLPERQKTHVLLPKLALLRRADLAAVIGEALTQMHAVRKATVREAAARAGVPYETVRRWRRRFRQRAEGIRVEFTELAHRWDPEQSGIPARASPEQDALEAIGMAVAAAIRRFGPDSEPRWGLVAGASGGRLLCNTS